MSRRLALVVCSTFVCALTPALGCGDDGGGGSADGTVLQDTGGSDATAPTDTGGGGDTTAPTDATVTDTATPDGTGPVDTSTPPDTSPPTWSITTSALTPTSACPGAEITLTATLVGDYPDPATVRVELSSPGGSFGSPRDLGTGTITGGSGEVTVTLPGDVTASTGYAVRVGGVGALGDDGEDLVVFAGPEFDLFFPKSYGTVRTTYTVSNDSTGDSWLWDLGPDATPSSSDDAEPTWTYATSGSKDVTLTITTADGCSATQTFPAANTVLGCDSAIGAGASVHREVDGSLDTGAEHWLCAGSSVEDGGGRRLVHVEPGATFDYRGGGTYGVVVRAGGAYRGSERVALVYETGADVRPDATIADAVECDTLTVDLSAAPANGCVTAGAPAVTATLGPVGAGPHCPGGELELAFVASAAPQTANRYLVQLSDDAGDFAGGEIVAQLASAAISGTIAVDLPAALESDGTYYVRLITTDPVSVSEPVGPLAVPALATADFSRSAGAPFVDEAVTFTDTTTGAHSAVHWDFGADATPATSTAASPSVTWSTPGVKTITFTATDASGCPISRTKSNVTVIGCTAQLPATTTLVTGQDNAFNGAGDTLVCGGADLTVFNAARTYYVMPGGKVRMVTGNLSGATFYVQGGGVFDGPSVNGGGDVVVAGAGALLTYLGGVQVRSCPDGVTFDTSLLSAQCPAYDPTPSVTAGAVTLASSCPGAAVEVPFTAHGAFAGDNRFTLQLSDASGSFASPTTLGDPLSASGTFSATIPQGTPPGTGYRLRVHATRPAVDGEAAGTFEVAARPTAAFTMSAATVLEGTAVTMTNASTGATSYAWTFGGGGEPATYADADPGSVTWAEEGAKSVSLTVGNAGGCFHTVTKQVTVLSCHPKVPGNAQVVTGTGSGGGGGVNVWVCDGGSYSAGGGSYSIFVEPGGTYTRTGGGSYTVYVADGGTYAGTSGGSTVLVRSAASNVSGASSHVVFTCPSVSFDRTNAPSPGCQ